MRLRKTRIWISFTNLLFSLAAASQVFSQPLSDSPRFTSTAKFQSIFDELKRKNTRPSHISNGGIRQQMNKEEVEVTETSDVAVATTSVWRVEMAKARWSLAMTNLQTRTVWRISRVQFASSRKSTGVLGSVKSLKKESNRWTAECAVTGTDQSAIIELEFLTPKILRVAMRRSEPDEEAELAADFAGPGPFFGLGERFWKAKVDGMKTTLRPEDDFGRTPDTHNWTYIPVPFLLSPRGLGLYVDSGLPTTFDLAEATQGRFGMRLHGTAADLYFFIDSGPKGVIESYTLLTGRPPIPPPWALGIWIDSRQGKQSVQRDAQRLRQSEIPASAIWIHDFMDHVNNLGWSYWTSGFWGKPRQLTDELHRMGYKVLAYRSPYVRSILVPYLVANPTFEEGVRRRLFALRPDGRPAGPTFEPDPVELGNIDFTNPEAVDWWQGMIERSLNQHGFDGWMEDFGEWVRDDDRFAVGKNGSQIANLYPLLYHMLTQQIASQAKRDFVGFARSGSAGSQHYSVGVWGGDQRPDWTIDNGLASVVTAGITAGLSGFSTWGPDVLSRGASKELWIRFAQFGALSPVMRDHVWEKPKFSVDLWFDSETTDIFRRYARLHLSLFPYLWTYAHRAADTGVPIMRHTMLESTDTQAGEAEHQYFLGEKILVAPVIAQGGRSRSVYLPTGHWVDYWTGSLLDGGRDVTVAAPLDRIPILVRAGSVIPLADPMLETLAFDLRPGDPYGPDKSLVIRVFSAAGSSQDTFRLYDGTLISAQQSPSRTRIQVEQSPGLRQYEIIAPASNEDVIVTLLGQRLDKLNDGEYRARKRGWLYDSDDSRVTRGVFG